MPCIPELKGAVGAVAQSSMIAVEGSARYARSIERVDGVSLLEFGTPEAMWHLMVKDFPAIVTMDAHGNSLHAKVEQETGEHLEEIMAGESNKG